MRLAMRSSINTSVRRGRLQVTAKDARMELERANTWVRQAVENALEMRAAASEIPASLERVAASLRCVAEQRIHGDMELLKPELDVLRGRMNQLERLLDAAAAFYSASVAHATGTESGCYTLTGRRSEKTPATYSGVHI